MAVLCLLTNTPWPWPTPAEAASARGGFPTLGTEWRGRSEAEVCTSEARKIRVLLARARGGASQEGLVSHMPLCSRRSVGFVQRSTSISASESKTSRRSKHYRQTRRHCRRL